VTGINFEAGKGGRKIAPRIALCRNADEYPLAVSVGIVNVPEGRAIGIETLDDGSGFHFDNDTGTALRSEFELVVPNAIGPDPTVLDTTALAIPDGARVTVMSPDGFDFRNVLFAVDHERDGQPETLVQYDAASGRFMPYVTPPEPWLMIQESSKPGSVDLVFPDGLRGWNIETNEFLEGEWSKLDTSELDVVIVDGLVITTVPIDKGGAFYFRLARAGLL
jgi:hypothetical protein